MSTVDLDLTTSETGFLLYGDYDIYDRMSLYRLVLDGTAEDGKFCGGAGTGAGEKLTYRSRLVAGYQDGCSISYDAYDDDDDD